MIENRGTPRSWANVKPAFRQNFGDTTSAATFAQDIYVSNLATFQGDFHKFYAHVARIVELHCEPFLNQEIELGEDHNFTNAQQARIANIVITNTRCIHDKLTLEFFLNGLPKEMFEKVATKPELTKPSAIIDYLKKCDIVARKDGIVPPPAAQQPQPMAAPVDDLNINNTYSQSYAAQARNSQRGNSNSNYRGRGGYNNSSRGQNNARGQSNNYRGQSFRGQNQTYRQNYNTGDRKPLICIYCKKPNHEQEKCFARIRDNQPCLSAKGTPYFPKKVNSASDSQNEEDVQEVVQPQAEQPSSTHSVFHGGV